jgi:hypothetical protein
MFDNIGREIALINERIDKLEGRFHRELTIVDALIDVLNTAEEQLKEKS